MKFFWMIHQVTVFKAKKNLQNYHMCSGTNLYINHNCVLIILFTLHSCRKHLPFLEIPLGVTTPRQRIEFLDYNQTSHQGWSWKNKVWPTTGNKIKTAGSPLLLTYGRFCYLSSFHQNTINEEGCHLVMKFVNLYCDLKPY